MRSYIWLAILAMAGVTYCIRVLPLTLIRRKIENRFLRSFLYYVPYVTLAVMTFPAITEATQSPIAGWAAMGVGLVCAWFGLGMLPVAILCCGTVIALEAILL